VKAPRERVGRRGEATVVDDDDLTASYPILRVQGRKRGGEVLVAIPRRNDD
jgi:hypothetical protein